MHRHILQTLATPPLVFGKSSTLVIFSESAIGQYQVCGLVKILKRFQVRVKIMSPSLSFKSTPDSASLSKTKNCPFDFYGRNQPRTDIS